MSEYERLYRRAEVRERWADIYLGDSAYGEWVRLAAAVDRFNAEVIKATRVEELANWLTAHMPRWMR